MTLAVQQEFRVGEVISQSFQTTIRNIIPFGILAVISLVIIGGLFLLVIMAFGISMPTSPGMMQPGEMPQIGGGLIAGLFIVGILGLAIYFGVMAAITYGTIYDLRGQPVGIVALLQSSINLIPPVLGTLLVLVGVFLGIVVVAFVLAFIPILGWLADAVLFVFLYIIFWVVIPVAVVERPGPVASLKRSVELTKGNRWRILGIILLVGIITGVADGIGTLLMHIPVIGWILQILISAVIVVFSAVLVAVGYYQLRISKEGGDIGDIAKVFD